MAANKEEGKKKKSRSKKGDDAAADAVSVRQFRESKRGFFGKKK